MPLTPRKRGRPPLDPEDPSRPVLVRLTGKQFDRVWREARRERITFSDYIRRRLGVPSARHDEGR